MGYGASVFRFSTKEQNINRCFSLLLCHNGLYFNFVEKFENICLKFFSFFFCFFFQHPNFVVSHVFLQRHKKIKVNNCHRGSNNFSWECIDQSLKKVQKQIFIWTKYSGFVTTQKKQKIDHRNKTCFQF